MIRKILEKLSLKKIKYMAAILAVVVVRYGYEGRCRLQ